MVNGEGHCRERKFSWERQVVLCGKGTEIWKVAEVKSSLGYLNSGTINILDLIILLLGLSCAFLLDI